jgi:RNA recognition motif-containing protein
MNPTTTFSLFMGGIPRNTHVDDIKDWLRNGGLPEVRSIRIARDRETGQGRGFCFIDANSEADRQALIQTFNGATFPDGRTIRAQVVRDDAGAVSRG